MSSNGRTKLIIFAIVAVVILVLASLVVVLSYNSLVQKDQNVKRSWSNIEVQYQRRIDLIPAVLDAVNTSMGFESSLLTNITNLRTQWLNALANSSVQQRVNVTAQLDVQLGAFLSVVEAYPDRFASIDVIQDYITVQQETENMIMTARIFYNDAVLELNTAVHSFPSGMFAGMFGFSEATYYQQGQ